MLLRKGNIRCVEMNIDRRNFIKILIVSLCLIPVAKFADLCYEKGIRKVLLAIKPSKYPGKLKPLDMSEVAKPVKWIG